MIAEMHKDFDALNILRPDMEPRATHHIAEIIELTDQLIAKGHAYVADNGDVMFDVPTDPTYGVLSRQDLDQLQAGARVTWSTTNATDGLRSVEDVERGRTELAVSVGRGPSRAGTLNVRQ